MIEIGREVGRGQMWNLTHKKKDGTYVTEEAREIAVNIIFIVMCYNYKFNLYLLIIILVFGISCRRKLMNM